MRPSQLLTPPRVIGASARLLASGRTQRGALLRKLGALGTQDLRRRWRNRRPVYAAG